MFEVKKSEIEGFGLFILYDTPKGMVLGYLRDGKRVPQRTKHSIEIDKSHFEHPSFSYINHSKEPNVYMDDSGRILSMADLEEGDELTMDYKKTERKFFNKFEELR